MTKKYVNTNFINGLRGIACFMVFFIHCGGFGLRELGEISNRIVDYGKYGVSIFFVISGFTIYYQLFNKKYSFKNFISNRLLRISVPYFPIIIFAFILNNDISLLNLASHIFFINSFIYKFQNTIIGVEWTLAIEVFYYFLIGMMIILFKDNKYKMIASSLLIIILNEAAMSVFRTYTSNHFYLDFLPFRFSYMFIMGGVAFFIRNKLEHKNEKLRLYASNIMTTLFFLLPLLNIRYEFFEDKNLFFALLTFFLISLTHDKSILSKKIFLNKFITFFGGISYSFYLIHYIVINQVFKYLYLESNFFTSIISLFISLFISTVYCNLFERNVYKKIMSVFQ